MTYPYSFGIVFLNLNLLQPRAFAPEHTKVFYSIPPSLGLAVLDAIHLRPITVLSLILVDSMSQAMLLTRRLNTFLSQNTTPQLPTLILLSPTGKLLSSSSPLPASTLRTQATVACSLWNSYQTSAPSLISASQPQSSSKDHPRGSDPTFSSASTVAEHELASIAIQFTHGTMVIQSLSCGLLFIAMGSTISSSSSPHPSSHTLHMQALSADTSPPSSPLGHTEGHELGLNEGNAVQSDAGSVMSTGTRTGGIVGLKRQAREVAKWLDSQLDGFSLSSGMDR